MLEDENDIDIDEIKKGFEMFDVEKTGFISPTELLETFDAMNLSSKNPFIYNIISSLSKTKKYSSKISLDELISYIDSKLNSNNKKGINLIFDSLCEPNNNHISLSSLPHYAREFDDIMTEKELRVLLQKAEMNGEEIEFDEFLKIMGEGKNLDEDDLDENDALSDKENIDENIKKNGGNIKENKVEMKNNNKNNLYENKYNINSHNSINSSNSNNNSGNKIYRKKPSNVIIQNNENINKNVSNKVIRNEKNINKKKKEDNEIININISEEIKKSENKNVFNKYRNNYNKKQYESPKKEPQENDDDSNENSNEENEETENGMESVNKSINKYHI